MPRGEALLDYVHVAGEVIVERFGLLTRDTSRIPAEIRAAGMLLPEVPASQELPLCLRDDPPSVIYTHSVDMDTDLMMVRLLSNPSSFFLTHGSVFFFCLSVLRCALLIYSLLRRAQQ